MNVLCLTGWQQPADALEIIAPGAIHFDYSAYTNSEAAFAALPPTPQLAIGWSLGGQLLVRAIAKGVVRPKALLLLGAPFQWVAGGAIKGIPKEAVAEVRKHYNADPQAMLKSLNALIALGDANEKKIIQSLNATLREWKNGLFWLDELTRASCANLDFSAFPPTTIVHGLADKVIYPLNAEAFASAIPHSRLQLWPNCAHAPQLHDADSLPAMVRAYV